MTNLRLIYSRPKRRLISARSLVLLLLLVPVTVTVFFAIQLHSLDVSHSSESVKDYVHSSISDNNHITNGKKLPTTTANNITNNNHITYGKGDPEREPILKILKQAGYDLEDKKLFTEQIMASLPKWSEITSFYGPPRILGLETCQAFREQVDAVDRVAAIAGFFNSGTNVLYYILRANCRGVKSIEWQVPWGKHTPASRRESHIGGGAAAKIRNTGTNPVIHYSQVLPVVSVRDPMTWMQSMCNQPYEARFEHAKHLCPNIKPYPDDIKAHPRFGKLRYMPVNVIYSNEYKIKHESLGHLWNEWHQEYMNVSFPRLIVRMEDIIFQAEIVLPQICQCIGGEYSTQFVHHADVSNVNSGIETSGPITGLIRAMIKYGNITNRRKGYPPFQLEAAKEVLDPKLMDLFGYRYEEP